MNRINNPFSVSLAALVVAAAVFSPAFAQDKMGGDKMAGDKMHADKMGGKMDKMAGKMNKMSPVYACKDCKMAYTPAQAKKMGMKDPMGHSLMKMAKMPAGMKMAPAGDKMGGDKMKGDKMKGDPKM